MITQYTPEWDSNFDLPYFYRQFLEKITDGKFLKKNLDSFKKVASSQACPIRKQDLKRLSLQNTAFLRNSKELLEESHKVSDRITPILAFYAHQQYSQFFIHTLFKYPITSVAAGHGLKVIWGEGKKPSIGTMKIQLVENGFFRRLVDTFTILGRPNAYSSWLPLRQDHKYAFVENSLDSQIKIGKIDLLSMMNFTSEDFKNEFLQHFPEQEVYPCQYDELLTEYSLLFVASNIARYRPQLWEEILAGSSENEARFNNKIKTIYQRISGEENIRFYLTFKYQIWAEFSMILNQEPLHS